MLIILTLLLDLPSLQMWQVAYLHLKSEHIWEELSEPCGVQRGREAETKEQKAERRVLNDNSTCRVDFLASVCACALHLGYTGHLRPVPFSIFRTTL